MADEEPKRKAKGCEAANLQKEIKDRLQTFGIAYNLKDDGPKKENKAVLKREKAAKSLFEFQLPLRCCWLFPKVRMPGMRNYDDAYGKEVIL